MDGIVPISGGESSAADSRETSQRNESMSSSQNAPPKSGHDGYNPYTTGTPTDSLLGKPTTFSRRAKRRMDYEWHEIFFLVVAIIAVTVAVGFSIFRMTEEYNSNNDKGKASFTFAILIVFNSGFLLVYAIHGIVFEHFEEMIAFALAAGVVFVYVAVDYGQHHSTADGVKLARFILVMVGFPVLAILALYCAKQFRWLKFRVAGASEEKQGMYSKFCQMESLLLFDFQIAVSLFILVLYRGSTVDAIEVALLSVGLVYCLAWAALGYYAARREMTRYIYLFELLSVLLPAYIAYKSVKIIQRWDTTYKAGGIEQLAIVFYIAAALALFVRALLLYITERVRRNFNQGLWAHVN